MIINRHNYEEFFLLYVDNELSAAERAQVEQFIKENSDLASELVMLQQATLQPDDEASFGAKSILIKSSDNINTSNYEEYFLRHVDGELSSGEKEDVERFVLQHPALQNEFTLLQQTKLQPEHIPFANKELLYRSERRRVIPLYILRAAVAAIFIGGAVALYLVTGSVNTGVSPAPQAVSLNKPAVKQSADETALAAENKGNEPTTAIDKQVEQATKNRVVVRDETSRVNTEAAFAKNLEKAPQPNIEVRRSVAPDPVIAPTEKVDEQQDLAVITTRDLTPENHITKQAVTHKDEEEQVMQQTVYKELDTRREEADNSILFGSTQINKNKLRGLFKKAARLFDKNEEKDPKEKSIQIASFELKGK